MRRVAVTGLGAVSALGIGVPALWDGVVQGRSGVRVITHFDPAGYHARVAAEVPTSTPPIHRGASSTADPFAQFALVAADEACRNAGLEKRPGRDDRAGAIGSDGRRGSGRRLQGCIGARDAAHPFSSRMMSNAAAARSCAFGCADRRCRSPRRARRPPAIGEAAEMIARAAPT